MASCLGLYIENNLIKYAKVSKSNDAIKVESFGVKFYENLESAIKQIVEETYSFKETISVNITDETYNKFEVFSLLSKKDIDGVIKTEFENICYDKDVNPNVYEQRYIITNSNAQNEKIKIIHISTTKTAITQKKNQFLEYKVGNMSPIGITIPNLLKKEKKNSALIVNIEKDTTITKVYNNIISDVITLPYGAQDIIDNINQKENSYAKAYEICKNSTIYTENDKDLQYEENEYLVDIMPILFQIVTEIRRIIEESIENIEKVYITGTASVINNIDIYFQDYLRNVQCEVLKPAFINNNAKINIKDYIEVNSAISIGLQGIEKNNNINFNKESATEKIFALLKTDFTAKSKNGVKNEKVKDVSNISNFVDRFTRQYNVMLFVFTFLILFYFVGSFIINKQIEEKKVLANESIQNTNNRKAQIENYTSEFTAKINKYDELIKNIESINNANSEDKRYRNTIPNLLNNIMAVIPKSVQLISIENTSDTHVVITAKSNKYEQVAFLKTKLKAEEILKNVVSDTGTMSNGQLTVTIEGELP